jgi:hypothetical protein
MHICKCDCGTVKPVKMYSLLCGDSTSCGCSHREMTRKQLTTHGLCKTRLHHIWAGIIARCCNENHKSYKNYGGRGIRVCEERRKDFKAFYDWAYSVGYNEEFTETGRTKWVIDRIDNDGDYCPENCRWATRTEQMRNTRRNHLIEYRGETKTLVDWCETLNLYYPTINSRLHKGWSVERSFETPTNNIFNGTH